MSLGSRGVAIGEALIVAMGAVQKSSAQTVLSDFSNFALTGTYEQWNGATFTSGPADFRVQAPGDFGGGWHTLPGAIDASGATQLQVNLDVNPNNVASLFNIVLFDGDGTQRVYRFEGLMAGADQSLAVDLDDFLQDNQPGGTPGLDVSSITEFHLQGSFGNGNPGLAMDLTFDNLALAVPEPASLLLAALAIIGLMIGTRRQP